MKKYYFAVDLGATSGRTILASVDGDNLQMEEVNRFPNHLIEACGHFHWDIFELYRNILEGLKSVADRGISLESIGIDTWGCDFVSVAIDGGIMRLPYSYRDPHTVGAPEDFFSTRCDAATVYDRTGIQVMNFNSLFQLHAMRMNSDPAFLLSDKILFIPDALAYLLTGNKVTEYTVATTGQIVNACTRQLDADLLAEVKLTPDDFGPMVYPGNRIGTLTPDVQRLTGLGAVSVIAVGSHDTASAVAAVPARTKEFAYLSSGTWSLMGIEVDEPIITDESRRLNFTNEGGVHREIRFLKNICGLWLLERCRSEWVECSYSFLIDTAMMSDPFRSLINPDDPAFANPISMIDAIVDYCERTGQPVPRTQGEFVRCIFDSLALRYRQVMDMLRSLAPFEIKTLHIIGGGAHNTTLNQMTADATGLTVVAGPYECTALGNIMIQARLTREQIAHSVETTTYQPADRDFWDAGYAKFLEITNK